MPPLTPKEMISLQSASGPRSRKIIFPWTTRLPKTIDEGSQDSEVIRVTFRSFAMTEPELTRAFVAGERSAFDRLVEAYGTFIVKVIKYWASRWGSKIITPEDVLDIYQETLLYLWRKRSLYNPELSFEAWVYIIAKSQVADHLRKRPKHDPLPDELMLTRIPSLQKSAEQLVFEQQISGFVRDHLSPSERSLIAAWIVEGLSRHEIANLMASTENAVKTNISRLSKKLKAFKERLF